MLQAPINAAARPIARTSLLRPPSHQVAWPARPPHEGLGTLVRSLGRETRHQLGGRELRVGVAQTPWQLEQAHTLLLKQYRLAGLLAPACPQLDSAKDGNRAVTLLAMHGINAMATLTMRSDCPQGLFADQHYAAQLDALRARGAQLCEFVHFAASHEIPVPALIGSLLQCAWRIGRENATVSDVVIECHPRHASFYRRALGFRPAGAPTTCRRVGAPAVLLHMRVAALEQRLNAVTQDPSGFGSEASLAAFLGVGRSPDPRFCT